MKKRLSKTLWYGTGVDSEGNPIVPKPATSSNDLEGLHEGELFLHLKEGKVTLWSLSADGAVVEISRGGGVDLSQYLLKSVWDKVWEIKTDAQGNEYIFGKLPVVTQYGITMYADGGNLNLPSIYAGLPIDGSTLIRDENGVLMINPDIDLGGGLTEVYWNDIKLKPTFATVATSGKYADLSGLPDLSVYATTEYLTAELKKYVTLNTEQTIAAHKNFLNGLSVGGLGITKSQDDVIYLDANLVVRGGITMYAEGEVDIPSILDSLPIASTTAKGIASFDSSYFSVDSDGKVTLLAENVGLNETELFDYLSRNDYAKKSEIPSLSGYATETYVEDRLDDLINGAPAAYDTLKEIADVLAGNVDSIGDIITTLGTKADKATTLSGYGITDAYTKSVVDALLGNYVTLATSQTITGEKNFTGGLKVNGSPIVYDTTNKYWKLEGDLLVTGGVTMFASDSAFTPSTIMDAIATDGTNLKVVNGVLTFVGSIDGGEAGSVAWENVEGKPSWIGASKPSYAWSEITGKPSFASVATSGKYADLSGVPTLLSSFTNDLEFVSKGTTLSHYSITDAIGYSNSIIASKADAYKVAGYGTTGGGFPINGGVIKVGINNYQMILHGRHDILRFNTVEAGTLKTWRKVWHDGNFTPSNYLLASSYTASDILAKLKTVDGEGSGLDADLLDGLQPSELNVGSATKLQTARTIWGQSFDGTKDITGHLTMQNNNNIYFYDTSQSKKEVLRLNDANNLQIGLGTSSSGYDTFLNGNNISLRYGTSHNTAIKINSTGNVLIGTTTDSGYKLDVIGDIRSTTNIRTPIATIDGIPIYKSQDDVLYIDGNLAVRGGITMYATDAIDVPSIIDSLPTASTSAKGLASFNPNFFSVDDNGNVSFIGSTGITEVNWTDIVGRPTLLSSFTNDQGFASKLGELANVGSWADSAPTQGRFLYQEAGSSEWSYKNISELISQTGAYLPLSGGSLEGSTAKILKITSTYVTTDGWHTPLLAYTPNMPSQAHANIEVGKSSSARNLAWFGFKYDSDGSYNNLLTMGLHSVNDALVINGYGYVGVGTLSPTTALDIYNGDVTANAYCVGRWNNSKADNMTNQLDYTISYLRTTPQSCGGNTLQHIIGWANTVNGASETRYTIGSWRAAEGYGKMIFNVMSSTNRLIELGLNGKTGYLQLTGSSEFGQYNQNMHHLFYGIGTGDGYYSVVELVSPNEVSISYGDNQRYSDPYRWSVGRAGAGSSARFQFWNAVANTAVVQIFTSGDFLTTGGITMYSDIRKKTKLRDVELSLKLIADAPLIEHYYNSDAMRTTHVGSIAQYWAGLNDWFCKKDSEGFYTMEIQNAALASAISIARELSRYETKTDRKIRLLKQRVKELEDKIEKLENN